MKNKDKYIPVGYKETVLGIIPNDWSVVHLKEKFDRITTKNKKGVTNVLTISAQHGLINQEEFFNKSVASKDLSNYLLLKKGDFAYNKSYSNGYPYGAIKKLKKYDEGVVSSLYICFRPSKNNNSADFYEQYFEAGMLNHEIHAIAQEGARNHGLLNISIEDFFNSYIIDGDERELNKIADILVIWDKAIELKEKLIEQKKQQKKGLMQKLLTGEVRLPGFDGEWEQVRLGELAKLQGGYAFKSSMFKEKGIPIVRISNILPEITDYNQEFVYYDEIKISDNFMVQYGDILIAMSGATTGKVGIYKKNEIAYLNQRVGKFVNLDKSKLA
nr:restriction endonuclease subunit S [Heyndrickxia coagulans]